MFCLTVVKKKREMSCRCEGGVLERIKVMKIGRERRVEGKCKCGKEYGGVNWRSRD